MPLEKRDSSKPGHVSVTFRVPAEAHATRADVVGEFTDWGLVAMQATADGSYEAAFDLEIGSTYRFRYLVNGTSWENDWAADNYVPNGYGGDDSVVDVREPDPLPTGQPDEDAHPHTSSFTVSRSRAATPTVEGSRRRRGSRESRF